MRGFLASPKVTPTSSDPTVIHRCQLHLFLQRSGEAARERNRGRRLTVGEKRVDHNRPNSEEDTNVTVDEVMGEGRLFPVAKSDAVVARRSSEVNDETEDDEAGENYDFEQRHPELDLSKDLRANQKSASVPSVSRLAPTESSP